MKVEIFQKASINVLQKEINLWLAKFENKIDIIKILNSGGDNNANHTIFIFYKEK